MPVTLPGKPGILMPVTLPGILMPVTTGLWKVPPPRRMPPLTCMPPLARMPPPPPNARAEASEDASARLPIERAAAMANMRDLRDICILQGQGLGIGLALFILPLVHDPRRP